MSEVLEQSQYTLSLCCCGMWKRKGERAKGDSLGKVDGGGPRHLLCRNRGEGMRVRQGKEEEARSNVYFRVS